MAENTLFEDLMEMSALLNVKEQAMKEVMDHFNITDDTFDERVKEEVEMGETRIFIDGKIALTITTEIEGFNMFKVVQKHYE